MPNVYELVVYVARDGDYEVFDASEAPKSEYLIKPILKQSLSEEWRSRDPRDPVAPVPHAYEKKRYKRFIIGSTVPIDHEMIVHLIYQARQGNIPGEKHIRDWLNGVVD